MSGLAESGHGVFIGIELDPGGSAGTFTRIAEVMSDVPWPEMSRDETETTPHESNIDCWNLGVLRRGLLTFDINYLPGVNATQDHLTGLQFSLITNLTQGFVITGPGGVEGTTDSWIQTGEVKSFQQTAPARNGQRTATVGIRFSGPMEIDSAAVGA